MRIGIKGKPKKEAVLKEKREIKNWKKIIWEIEDNCDFPSRINSVLPKSYRFGKGEKRGKRGRKYYFFCPFHQEKKRSFSWDILRRKFYCFGCGKSVSIVGYFAVAHGLEGIEAVIRLAKFFKIKINWK